MTVSNIQLPLFSRCPRCRELKPLEAFPRNRRRPNGYHNACKVCHAKTESKRYRDNKPRISATRRLRRHGVSAETFDFLLRTQDYKCADCGRDLPGLNESACVDHDRGSGRVRALLCNSCNLRIGMAHHSIDVLIRDIIYLLKHSTPEMMRVYFHTLTSIFAFVPLSQVTHTQLVPGSAKPESFYKES
jgi:DNA-directed RNA polymerase subunit RPC12/RpoP